MLGPLPEVALECLTCLVTERTSPWPPALAEDQSDVLIKVDIVDCQPRNLGQSHSRVQEQPDDGRVPTILEASAAHAGKQASDRCSVQDRHRFLWHRGWAEPSHRRGSDKLLLHHPAVELLEATEADSDRGGSMAAE